MKRYQVSYTTDASYDLLAISIGIISEYSDPMGAKRTTDKIASRCESLSVFPEVSPVKAVIMGKKIYFAHSGKFTIIYTIDKSKYRVVIYRIVGSMMNIDKILKNIAT